MILLCSLNSKFIHSSLASYCLKSAYDHYSGIFGPPLLGQTVIYECTVNDSYETLLYNITSVSPEAVAFSVYIWNVDKVVKLCRDIRKVLPHCAIILGGPEVSFGLKGTGFEEELFDILIKGEGERAFYASARFLGGDKDPWSKMDVSYDPENKTVIANKATCLDSLPFVYNEENIDSFKNRILYYESSRGCPFGCSYCLSSAEKGVGFLNIERVFREIDFFVTHNIPLVKFVDRTFNCRADRAYDIYEKIINLDCNTCFHFEVAADLFDERTLELLSKAPKGRIQLEIGIQSTNPDTLQASCRKTDISKVFDNIKRLISFGNINIHCDLIIGLPYESYDIFINSFNTTYEMCKDDKGYIHQLQLGFLKLLHGAPLNRIINEHEYIFSENPPYNVLGNKYLTSKEINKLRAFEDVFERYYNSGRYVVTLSNILGDGVGSGRFSDAFEFYALLGEYYIKKGIVFTPVSSRRLTDILVDFLSAYYDAGKMEEIKGLLLFDYFASDMSDLPPESLHSLWRPERYYRNMGGEIYNRSGLKPSKKNIVRFIKDKAYIFDYSSKDPVTQRYKVLYFT